jgi:voltage-gated potassium channel
MDHSVGHALPPGVVRPEATVENGRHMPRLQRVSVVLEWPMAVLALLVIPALVMEERAVTPGLRLAGIVLNWVIWIGFCAEFAVRWAADGRASFPRRAWFDTLLIVLTPPFGVPEAMQGVRSLRVLRLLRLLRAFAVAAMALRLGRRHFGKQGFHFVALVAVATVILGAVAVYVAERGANDAIGSFGDALWWAIVTATTVGYGDVSPVTLQGRVIAVFLMITGIGVIGVFTATVASFFFEREQEAEIRLSARLETLERKVDELRRLLERERRPD